MMQRYGVFWFI